MTVSKRLRFEVLRRDNHACRYCGRSAPEVKLTVDHVVPTTLGGTDDPSNLAAACADCNSGKSSMPAGADLIADVAGDALRWGAAMHRATEIAMAEREKMIDVERQVLDYWSEIKAPYRNETYADYLPNDWYLSIQRWLAAGLTDRDFLDASHIALIARGKRPVDAWKYFCGICWRLLEERQTTARQLIEAEEAERAE